MKDVVLALRDLGVALSQTRGVQYMTVCMHGLRASISLQCETDQHAADIARSLDLGLSARSGSKSTWLEAGSSTDTYAIFVTGPHRNRAIAQPLEPSGAVDAAVKHLTTATSEDAARANALLDRAEEVLAAEVTS